MQVVILAGGMQSTLSMDEGIPKPMLEIGGKPLLWHIMKGASEHGVKEFVVCGGYKIELIKEYFQDFYIYESDITVDLSTNRIEIHKDRTEDWKVTILDTGLNTGVLQRVQKARHYLQDHFFVIYGDCLSDIDYNAVFKTHMEKNRLATITLVKPTGRKQMLSVDDHGHLSIESSAQSTKNAWISGDCYLMRKTALDQIGSDARSELDFFRKLSSQGELAEYQHKGFWSSIETRRDFVAAEKLWMNGIAPWCEGQQG